MFGDKNNGYLINNMQELCTKIKKTKKTIVNFGQIYITYKYKKKT